MSFPENPYAHMNLVTAPPMGVMNLVEERVRRHWEGRRDRVEVHCEGCGAEDVAKGVITIRSPIGEARAHFDRHIMSSHGRTPKDCLSWSWD
jgi:hypothetical protein